MHVAVAAVAMGLGACATSGPRLTMGTPPDMVVGDFIDDYGSPYSISPTQWAHGAEAKYRIVEWFVGDEFLVAQNHADNPGEGGLWTRIDWVQLDGANDYPWAFCYTVYDAETRAAALEAPPSGRDMPRTGCNGFPFSRMKRVDPSGGG